MQSGLRIIALFLILATVTTLHLKSSHTIQNQSANPSIFQNLNLIKTTIEGEGTLSSIQSHFTPVNSSLIEKCNQIPAEQLERAVDLSVQNIWKSGKKNEDINTLVYLYAVFYLASNNCSEPQLLERTTQNLENNQWILGSGKTLNDWLQRIATAKLDSGMQYCKEDTPFFDGASCVSCDFKNLEVFDLTLKKCSKCLFGFQLDPEQHQCLKMDAIYITNPFAVNIISDDYSKYSSEQAALLRDYEGALVCPSTTPYSRGSSCISCQQPTPIFNESSMSCSDCMGGEFQLQIHGCKNVPPPSATMSNPLSLDRMVNLLQLDNFTGTPCPPDSPFYVKEDDTCIDCLGDKNLFNNMTGECMECPETTELHVDKHECISNLTWAVNLDTTNWTARFPIMMADTYYDSFNETYSMCNLTKPVVIDKICGTCPDETPYFNMDNMSCEINEGRTFSEFFQKEMENNPEFLTNPETASNLLYSGTSKGEWKFIYDQAKEENPDLQDCPQSTPFYNGIQCVMCPENYPYFNLQYQDCMNCEEGSTYDAETKECLDLSGQPLQPNLEKMMSSVFSHKMQVPNDFM